MVGTTKKPDEDQQSYSVSSSSRGGSSNNSFKMNLPDLRSSGSALIVAAIIMGLLSGYVGSWLQNRDNSLVGTSVSNEKKVVTSQSQLISQIAKTVGPSVVSVNVNVNTSNAFGMAQQAQGAGTGIIIDPDGLIVTNRHVVPAGTTNVSVTLSDGTQLKDVSVVGRTSDSDTLDIAFLKVNDAEGHKMPAAKLGNSTVVQVGDNVVAIGNALGQFQNTVTSGIISGYGRSLEAGDSSDAGATGESLVDLFQTDASINAGNSGGPLVNLNGQVIGINTAVAGGAENIGFAIPINDVKGLIDQVVKTGKFARPYLGVRYVQLTDDTAEHFKLNTQNGAFIAPTNDPALPSVVPDSPAAGAGLQTNDVITAVDRTKIDQNHSLTALLAQHQPGDKVQLTVLRDGKTVHITVKLGTAPTN